MKSILFRGSRHTLQLKSGRTGWQKVFTGHSGYDLRPFNTYGLRQLARVVIPTIIAQLLAGRKETKLGYLMSTRDFSYVKDTVKGFVAIYESDKCISEEINIATQKENSIGGLAKELIRQINPKVSIVYDEDRRSEKSEVNRLPGNNEKIQKLTNWKVKYSFEEGLAETIEFFRDHLDKCKSDLYNI